MLVNKAVEVRAEAIDDGVYAWAEAMPAAINPYSIAVAADWSAKNLREQASSFPTSW